MTTASINLLIICSMVVVVLAMYFWKSYKTDINWNYYKNQIDNKDIQIINFKHDLDKMTKERDRLQERIDKHNANCIGKNNKI